MSQMYLKQSGFTYRACGLFTKNRETIQIFMQPGDIRDIYWNKIDKACFQHDMSYGRSKDLVERTESDKVLRDKAFKIEIIITSFIEMLELPNFGHMTTSAVQCESRDKILLMMA